MTSSEEHRRTSVFLFGASEHLALDDANDIYAVVQCV